MRKFIVLEKKFDLKKEELIDALRGLIAKEIKHTNGRVKTIESIDGDYINLLGDGKPSTTNLESLCKYYDFNDEAINKLASEYTTLLSYKDNVGKYLTTTKNNNLALREKLWDYINSNVPFKEIVDVKIGRINSDPQYLELGLKDGVLTDKGGKVNIGFNLAYNRLSVFIMFYGEDCNEKRNKFIEFAKGIKENQHAVIPATDDSKNVAGVHINDGYYLNEITDEKLKETFNYLYELFRDVVYLINF